MFLDWEVQYSATISHVAAMKSLYADCTQRFYWIALPVTTESGISQYEPAWTAWEPGKKWVRQPPEDAITDPDFFPFYHPGIIFEDFTPSFNQWITGEGTESARKLSSSSGSASFGSNSILLLNSSKITAPTCSSISCRERENCSNVSPALSGSE